MKLPKQNALITSVAINSTGKEKEATVAVSYSNNSVLEFSAHSAAITPFGALLHPLTQRVLPYHPIRTMFWGPNDKLFLQDPFKIVHFKRKSVTDFDWSAVPDVKRVRIDGAGKFLGKSEKFLGKSEKQEKILSRKFRGRYAGDGKLADPFQIVFDSMATVKKRENSFIVTAQPVEGQETVCLELRKDLIFNKLPAPLHIPKFGAK